MTSCVTVTPTGSVPVRYCVPLARNAKSPARARCGATLDAWAGSLFADMPSAPGLSQSTRKPTSLPSIQSRAEPSPTRRLTDRSARNRPIDVAAWSATRQQHRALRTEALGAATLTRWEVAEVVLRFWLGTMRRTVKFLCSGYRIAPT